MVFADYAEDGLETLLTAREVTREDSRSLDPTTALIPLGVADDGPTALVMVQSWPEAALAGADRSGSEAARLLDVGY